MKNLILLAVVFAAYPLLGFASKKVLLTGVQTLTLQSDKFTTGRRNSPIPQLRCIDGKTMCKNLPSAVQCYNMGSDGMDVQWKCEAQLPQNMQFDTLQVQCEGYDYPDDPYVLAGSCGLTYSLKPAGTSSGHKHHKRKSHQSENVEPSSITFLVVVVILGSAWLIYACCLAPGRRTQPQATEATAPPPYDGPPPPYQSGGGQDTAPGYGFRPEFTQQQQQQQWPGGSKTYGQEYHSNQGESDEASGRPGFWTGAAVGGLAGYLFGRGTGGGSGGCYGNDSGWSSGARPHSTSGYHGNANSHSSSSSTGSDEAPVTRTGYATTRRR